jgi:drug/metabolite transporter (DMT)-like permease
MLNTLLTFGAAGHRGRGRDGVSGQKVDPWAVGAVVAAALIWSSSYAVTKVVLEEVGPLSIGAVRFTLSALLLGVMVRVTRLQRARPDRAQRRRLYASGLLGITVYFILGNVGVDLSTASDASLIVATYPLMTMLVERVLYRAPLRPRPLVGVLLAAAGCLLIVRSGADVGGSERWVGDILLLLGGLAWAGYTVLTKRASVGMDAVGVTYHQTVAGAAGFLLASLLEVRDWQVPDVTTSALLLYLTVACSILAFLLYNHGLRRMPSPVAVNILNLVPVFGVLGAVVINGEAVHAVQLAGGAIVIAGVVLGVVDRDPVREPDAPDAPEAPDVVSRSPTRGSLV